MYHTYKCVQNYQMTNPIPDTNRGNEVPNVRLCRAHPRRREANRSIYDTVFSLSLAVQRTVDPVTHSRYTFYVPIPLTCVF